MQNPERQEPGEAKWQNLYCGRNENIKAYVVGSHRHTLRLKNSSGMRRMRPKLSFTLHLVPMNRGILVTEYASLKRKSSQAGNPLGDLCETYYGKEPFIRILDDGVCSRQNGWKEVTMRHWLSD